MIIVRNIAAQGDVFFRRVEHVRPDAAAQPSLEGEPVVVAHSETGHHHVVESRHATFLTTSDPLVGFLRFEGPFADVVHLRSFHTHETLRLLGNENGTTSFEIRRQRAYVPDGWREKDWRNGPEEDWPEDAFVGGFH
jgi:hypothetical protein